MKLEDLNTYDELSNYLLDRIDYADGNRSNCNKSFSKEEIWNSLIDQCVQYSGDDLPIRTKSILIKNVKKDFGMNI